jgi:hypothetical protein
VEQNILLAITSSKIKLYTYMQPDNPNCFDEKKFNITIYPLNNLDLKGGVLCVDYNTGQILNVSKFKIRPNKVYSKLVFKREIIGIRS